MGSALDREEVRLAQELERRGMSKPAALVAIVMATRGHARPESELVEILRQYGGLESSIEVRRGIRELLARKWLVQTESYGSTITHQAPELRELIGTELGDPLLAEKISLMRANLGPPVRLLGPMNDTQVYHTFLNLLRSAEQEICLPMLATAPYDVIVGILRERAEAGVQVRILLAAPELVAKWRGQPMREKAVERIQQWRAHFRDRRSVTIRMCRTEADMELATCVSVDGGLVRLDIYDPYRQRSLDGVMIEVESPAGYAPNVVRIFGRLFETAWQRSLRFGRLARTTNFLGRWWKAWMAVLVLAAAFLPISVPHWSEILIGISCGVGAPVIIEDLPERYWTNRKRRTT